MNNVILECNKFFINCGFTYAICGGYALELYLNKKIRTHGDLDVSIFDKDRNNAVKFILNNGWEVYGRKEMTLFKITDSTDNRLPGCFIVWAIKLDCSVIKLNPVVGDINTFTYDILSEEQLNFDFIDISFNKQQNGSFVCDRDKNITRKLDMSIKYNNSVPYLSPEIKLFFPRYMELDYFKNKNQTDFEAAAPFLPEENRTWLINALEKAYPDGNKRIEQLKNINPVIKHY